MRRRQRLYQLARHGRIPAEELRSDDREALVAELHAAGWTDLHIAEHTRETEYVIARIRVRLGLAANEQRRAS